MRIERYYASVREDVTPLSNDAGALIDAGDYIGFFKACGPTYVRGIRRAQEVTAFFMFKSSSNERSASYSRSVRLYRWRRYNYGSSTRSSSTNKSESTSTQIVIKGWGLGLNQEGSETFVASSLEDFSKIMDFAFSTMTRVPDSVHIGQVYGMEVVPWVSNSAFQVRAQLLDNAIEVPVIRSLIPRAYRITDNTDVNFNNTNAESRALFTCKEIAYAIDQYGYCCEEESLYNLPEREYDASNPEARMCRPLRVLDPSLVKENLAANGEFIARLDRAVRYRLNQLGTLERCISAVRAIPERYDFYLLKSQDTVKIDTSIELDFSVFELKLAVDPFEDYRLLKHMAKELDEFLDMYIQPCYAELFGTNQGASPETDASFLMSYPWHSHDICTKLSCLGNGMRWDRANPLGGCTPSMMAGASAPAYDTTNEGNCNRDIEKSKNQSTLACKHDTAGMANTHDTTTAVWNKAIPTGRADYYIDTFCMPQVRSPAETHTQLTIDSLRTIHKRTVENSGLTEMSINVAENKPAKHSSTYPHGGVNPVAGLAVDGNNDGKFFTGKSASHTRRENNPWWEVDLERSYEIMSVVVWNRQDGGEFGYIAQRLSGFRVILFNEGVETFRSPDQNQVINRETRIAVPNGTMADKVRIVLPRPNTWLQLAEVEVMNRFYA